MKKVVFHGGCLSCTMQKDKDITECLGCQYFQSDWDLPSLNTEDRPDKSDKSKIAKLNLVIERMQKMYDEDINRN